MDYNRAQFELYVALGQPPADSLARPVPIAGLAPSGLPGTQEVGTRPDVGKQPGPDPGRPEPVAPAPPPANPPAASGPARR